MTLDLPLLISFQQSVALIAKLYYNSHNVVLFHIQVHFKVRSDPSRCSFMRQWVKTN